VIAAELADQACAVPVERIARVLDLAVGEVLPLVSSRPHVGVEARERILAMRRQGADVPAIAEP
jgi:hypothetical protein